MEKKRKDQTKFISFALDGPNQYNGGAIFIDLVVLLLLTDST